jgi:hypothetical protein
VRVDGERFDVGYREPGFDGVSIQTSFAPSSAARTASSSLATMRISTPRGRSCSTAIVQTRGSRRRGHEDVPRLARGHEDRGDRRRPRREEHDLATLELAEGPLVGRPGRVRVAPAAIARRVAGAAEVKRRREHGTRQERLPLPRGTQARVHDLRRQPAGRRGRGGHSLMPRMVMVRRDAASSPRDRESLETRVRRRT